MLRLGGVFLGLLIATPAIADDPPGMALYKRCAACHLANGKGVPGAFPPLVDRLEQAAASEAGRAYLVLTVTAGIMGPIDVDGRTYRGIMPAQAGLSDADIAAVLNYAKGLKSAEAEPAGTEPFTAEEVAAIRAAHPGSNPRKVHALRNGVFDAAGTEAQE